MAAQRVFSPAGLRRQQECLQGFSARLSTREGAPNSEAPCAALHNGTGNTTMHAEAALSHDKPIGAPKGDRRISKSVAPFADMTGTGFHPADLLISFFGRVETAQAMTASRSRVGTRAMSPPPSLDSRLE